MRLALGADHRGFPLKAALMSYLEELGHSYQDFGTFSQEPVDYPDIALPVARGVANGEYDRGILVCGTGVGMCVAANKVKGARAAWASDPATVRQSREHVDANILCLAGDSTPPELAKELARVFLTTPFQGGRHQRRVDKIKAMEG